MTTTTSLAENVTAIEKLLAQFKERGCSREQSLPTSPSTCVLRGTNFGCGGCIFKGEFSFPSCSIVRFCVRLWKTNHTKNSLNPKIRQCGERHYFPNPACHSFLGSQELRGMPPQVKGDLGECLRSRHPRRQHLWRGGSRGLGLGKG